jgi:hypothetical protein
MYDAITSGIRKFAPTGSKNMQFMALALGNSGSIDYVEYFLNKSNHPPGTPLNAISFHHYGQPNSRDGSPNNTAYEQLFTQADGWIPQVQAIMAARDALNPTVILDADEVGVILPDDNDNKFTADEPGFPAIFWNAAAAMYVYLFGVTSQIGLDVLGHSQLIGYPSIPFPRGAPYNGNWTAPPQFPSVSLLSWGGVFGNPGDGTAKYWALKLLVDEFRAGPPAGLYAPADADVLVSTVTTGGGPPLSSPFCASVPNLDTLSMFCATGVINAITFASYGTPTGACGSWAVNPACNAPNSSAIVTAACVGKASCTVAADTPTFGDPCYGTVKTLAVEATCSTGGGAQTAPLAVFAQAFVEAAGSGARKVLIVNKSPAPQTVSLAGASGATWNVLDEASGFGPARAVALASDMWTLAPYALGVLRL